MKYRMFALSAIFLATFLSGFGLGFLFSSKNPVENALPHLEETRFSATDPLLKREQNRQLLRESNTSFYTKLNQRFNAEECLSLFHEIIESSPSDTRSVKLNFLFEHWGKVAPKEALRQLNRSEYLDSDYVLDIYRGWCQQDPENALHYLEEIDTYFLRKNLRLPMELSVQALDHLDADYVWNWIQRQKVFLRKDQGVELESYFQNNLKSMKK